MITDNNTESLPSNAPAEIYIGFKSIFFGITCWSKGWFVESQIIDAQDKWGEIHKYIHHKEHEALREENKRMGESLQAWRKGFPQRVCEWRHVDKPCDNCGGSGTKMYGSTSTWRRGVGGQMMTTDVCDKCWGSGDALKPWPSHREIAAMQQQLDVLRGALKQLEETHAALCFMDKDASEEKRYMGSARCIANGAVIIAALKGENKS